jgi:hypothetical protein
MSLRDIAPIRGLLATFIMCALVAPSAAQPKRKPPEPKPAVAEKPSVVEKTDKKDPKVKNFDFNALDLAGRMRTPQLLYFLERANEELERASLKKRSFIPHMVRSVEEEKL